MNDRIPGSSYDNPIWYRNHRIFVSGEEEPNREFAWEAGGDEGTGYAHTVEKCKAQIDDYLDGPRV